MQLVIIMYNLYDKFDDYNLYPHVSVIVNVIVGMLLLVIISTLLCPASSNLWYHRASGPHRLQVIYNNQEILHGGLNMYLHVNPS